MLHLIYNSFSLSHTHRVLRATFRFFYNIDTYAEHFFSARMRGKMLKCGNKNKHLYLFMENGRSEFDAGYACHFYIVYVGHFLCAHGYLKWSNNFKDE